MLSKYFGFVAKSAGPLKEPHKFSTNAKAAPFFEGGMGADAGEQADSMMNLVTQVRSAGGSFLN